MAQFNPSTTATKGVEWSPAVAGSVTLDALTKCACMSILQTTDGSPTTIPNEKVYLGAIPSRGGLYSFEVYDDETAVPANVTSIQYRPNEDVSGSGSAGDFFWTEDDGTTSTIYTEIDEVVLDLTDYIKNVFAGGAPGQVFYRFRVGSAAALTGKRILGVRLVFYGEQVGFGSGQFYVGLNISGTDYAPTGAGSSYVSASSSTPAIVAYPYNPATKKPWTIADVQAFDATDALFIEVFNCCGEESRVYQAYLDVIYCDENRIAVGTLDDTSSALTTNAWNTAAVTTPTGSAWSKDATGRHLYLLRRISSSGAVVIPTLAGVAVPNPATGFAPTLDSTYGYVTAMNASTLAVFGVVQRTNGPADSVDSQPYTLQVEGKVYNGQVAKQEFSNAGVLSYGQVRALVKPNSATGNLLIKCKRVSDDVQFGSTITWTAAQVAALVDAGGGWKQLDSQMGTAGVLAAATQYYLEFSDATAADTGTGTLYWSVLALDVGDASTGVGAGFGSTTDAATVNGARATRYDIPATIATIPTPPAGFGVTVLTQTL